MATRQSTASTRAAPAHQQQQAAAARPEPSELTADRIRAFLASVRPLRGCTISENYYEGRAAIERIALRSRGAGSGHSLIELSAKECADVLAFLRASEPVSPATWWRDPADAPSHISGLHAILFELEAHARYEQASAEQDTADHAADVDKRLNAIRTRLWNIAGIVACVIATDGEEGTSNAGNALQLVRRELRAIADSELYAEELLAADAAQEVDHG